MGRPGDHGDNRSLTFTARNRSSRRRGSLSPFWTLRSRGYIGGRGQERGERREGQGEGEEERERAGRTRPQEMICGFSLGITRASPSLSLSLSLSVSLSPSLSLSLFPPSDNLYFRFLRRIAPGLPGVGNRPRWPTRAACLIVSVRTFELQRGLSIPRVSLLSFPLSFSFLRTTVTADGDESAEMGERRETKSRVVCEHRSKMKMTRA
jgi:hypothetical protein